MNLRTFASSILASALALLVLAPAAGARPGARTFAQTFPAANNLCAKADAGTLPGKLKSSSDQVKAACTTLHGAYDAAVTKYKADTAGLADQAKAAVATAKAACATMTTTTTPSGRDRGNGGGSAACRAARQAAHQTLRELRTRARAAAATYRTSIQAGRHAFWTTIHHLRGGDTVATDDNSSTGTPTGPTLPGDASV